MNNRIKQEKTALGRLGVQLLAYAQMRKKEFLFTGEIARVLGLGPKQESDLLGRLSARGIIIRLKRGAYLVPDRIPPGGRWNASEYYILKKLMQVYDAKFQISGPNAFNYWGFDNQMPNRLYVYNNKIYGEKKIGGKEFVFIKTAVARLEITTGSLAKSNAPCIVSMVRALLDAVYDWSRYNTLPRAYDWILKSIKNKSENSAKAMINVTAKYGNKASIRRIGFLLDEYGVSEKELLILKRALGKSKSLIPWIPGRKAAGKISYKWGIIINGEIQG
jgi:predicted transcriptional regulator of viral defense system